MTRKQWKQMTPDQRRIEVAELCGWRWEVSSTTTTGVFYFGWKNPKGVFKGWGETKVIAAGYTLPQYLNDLNDMHEAEKIIRAKKPKRNGVVYSYVYEAHLLGLTNGDPVYATAAQRAEAFVLTLE